VVRKIVKIALSKFTIPALLLGICICIANIAFNVGVAYGEEKGKRELLLSYAARNEYPKYVTSDALKLDSLLYSSDKPLVVKYVETQEN